MQIKIELGGVPDLERNSGRCICANCSSYDHCMEKNVERFYCSGRANVKSRGEDVSAGEMSNSKRV